ncbi:MAG: ROK family protein [Oscillospiraceae bacterium]|nr:ROK family protein [Oscillospiraceae bacterium]
MKFLGVDLQVKNTPVYDPGFLPMLQFNRAFLKQATKPLTICIERNGGLRSVYDTFITGTNTEADRYYVARMVKYLLWARGGYRVTICGDAAMADYMKAAYAATGQYAFDSGFMEQIYEQPFAVVYLPLSEKPREQEQSKPVGGNLTGCRIGFDAGGSDRKVSAVIDGKAVFSEEVVWHPKINPDPEYHFNGIVEAFQKAASKLPRVDAIGVSSAGIYIDNRTRAASLFLKVSPEAFEKKVKDIYIRAAEEIGNVPLAVVNDGDVTALAGAMEFGEHNVFGIAMGTSKAGGFIDENGHIKGWLNELAFAPVDASPDAVADEWSGDIGCGVKYFSQDAVIKLAERAGIVFAVETSPGERLKIVQDMLARGEKCEEIRDIFRSIGVYLGHTLPLHWEFYHFAHVLLLGRVMSGAGGDLILDTAKQVIAEEYGEYAFTIRTFDEKARRVGQSVAAASL